MKQEESAGRRLWRLVYPYFTYMGLMVLLGQIGGVLASAYVMLHNRGMSTDELVNQALTLLSKYSYELTITAAVIAIPIQCLYMRIDQRRLERQGIEKPVRKHISTVYYLAVIAAGFGACIMLNHLLAISGLTETYAESFEEVSSVLYQGHLLVELIGIGLIVPVAEELVFRVLTMGRMKEQMGANMAIVLSALLFAVSHGNILQGIFAFFIGLLLGYVYHRFQSMLAPILLHCAVNVTSVLMSETDIFWFFYSNEAVFWGITVLTAVLLIGAVYAIQYHVEPSYFTSRSESPEADR